MPAVDAAWAYRRGLIFIFAVFFVSVQCGVFAGYKSEKPSRKWLSVDAFGLAGSKAKEHPIPKLMKDAEERFKGMLNRQSETLDAAVVEYRNRYDMDPPKGFDEWFAFAKQNEFRMMDEFDGLMEDLAPFRNISGKEFRRRVQQVSSLPSIDIVRVRDGKGSTVNLHNGFDDAEASSRAHGFRRMIEPFEQRLPDLDFPINAKAEGRILVPWEHQKYPNLTTQDSSGGVHSMVGDFTADWRGSGNVWEAYRRTCAPTSPARQLFSSLRPSVVNRTIRALYSTDADPAQEFTFAEGTDTRFSFCDNPWAHYFQGHFFSDWRTISVLYPILSPAKGLGFGDIRIPSHYYHGSTPKYTYGWDAVNMILKDVDDMEMPWELKNDKIFWRGATTGGGSSPPGFAHQYQRQRFVRMASDRSRTEHTVVFLDPSGSGEYLSTVVPASALNEELMDVAFTTAVDKNNYPGGLATMQKELRFSDPVPLGEHWSHKYLVDFDGMSYSGRFMAFLASDSAVVKSTVYQEFFSDWIQPWLHFIPLSSTYKEIYNIHAFFSGPSESTLVAANLTGTLDKRSTHDGDRRLRRIARAGKHWKRTVGRKVDMEVYVYRLCLEYARLWADDRDAVSYTL
ncbi:glycosyltransferase family 90 protein [Neolentinus lepideus HHB14362 ss-1]|uniref:Glycosyltransferase family 90 protein n=1 Tax=Neolentinus lepideus HHB14362 ss-1 TaxID=1314782 RepID=A0A165T350_9AGAM|nr:glycosyltransferase family 90 protein [Neolentinus lepideus HHB14362 ss-1]